MRIRCRSIPYETLALDIEVTESSHYELLSHVRPDHLPKDQLTKFILDDDKGESTKTCFEKLGSAVPIELCYLRPIPIQPAIDAFEAQIDNASSHATKSIHDSNTEMKMIFFKSDLTIKYTCRNDWEQCSDFLLGFGRVLLEEEAVALRNQSDVHYPRMLQHVRDYSLPHDDSCVGKKWNSQCHKWVNRLMPNIKDCFRINTRMTIGSRLNQNANVNGDGGCHWQTWKGQNLEWDESSARKELSLLLLHRIHELQNIDFDHVEEALSCQGEGVEIKSSAGQDWLQGRKERWKSERFYRRSMTIVEEHQIYNRLMVANADGNKINRTARPVMNLVNETNCFLRTDPVVPGGDPIAQTSTRNSFYVSPSLRSFTMALPSNRRIKNKMHWLTSNRSKMHGSCAKVQVGRKKETAPNAKRSWLDSLVGSETTLDHLLKICNPTPSQNTNENCETQDPRIDIKIDFAPSHLPSDPHLPSQCCPDIMPISLSNVDLSKMKHSHRPYFCKENISRTRMVSKRRRDGQQQMIDRPKLELQGKSSVMPSMNGIHLRNISSFASPFQGTTGIFLPHVREIKRPEIEIGQVRLLSRQSMQGVASRNGLRPSFQTKRRPNAIYLSHFDKNQWKKEILKYETRTVRLDSVKSSSSSEHEMGCLHLDSSHEQSLADSVVIRGEFIHLSIKSRGLGSTQIITPHVQEERSQTLCRSGDKNNREPSAPPQETTDRKENHCSSERDTKHDRKRRERSEAKKARKEQKRRKKEKKREKKANRNSRKRKNIEESQDTDNIATSSTISCSSVANTQAGITPTVSARALQINVEVSSVHQENIQLQSPTYQHTQNSAVQNDASVNQLKSPKTFTSNSQELKSRTAEASRLLDGQIQTKEKFGIQYNYDANNGMQKASAFEYAEETTTEGNVLSFSPGNRPSNATAMGYTEECPLSAESKTQLNSSSEQPRTVSTPGMEFTPPYHNSSNNRTGVRHKNEARSIEQEEFSDRQTMEGYDANDSAKTPQASTRVKSNLFPVAQNHVYGIHQKTPNEHQITGQDQNEQHNIHQINENHSSQVGDPPKSDDSDMELELLCSEQFLEDFSQAAAELSSGRWVGNYAMEGAVETLNFSQTDSGKKFNLRDCSLVDDCGVDVELPDRVAIKIVRIKSRLRQGIFDSRTEARQLVQLASCGRYTIIHTIVVLDANKPNFNYYLDDFSTLQNSVVKQRGCLCQQISFQYSAPSSLSAIIAKLAFSNLSTPDSPGILFDYDCVDKGAFLLGLVPSMTVHECLLTLRQKLPFGQILLNAVHNSDPSNIRRVSIRQLKSCVSADIGSF